MAVALLAGSPLMLSAPQAVLATTSEITPDEPPSLSPPPSLTAPLARSNDDLQADVPPLTPYDLDHTDVPLMPENRSIVAQIGRSLLALLFVVGLIYLFAKWVLPRLIRHLPGASGTQLKIVERIQLDPKHALVLVEVTDGERLLIGCGDGGVRLVAQLSQPAAAHFTGKMDEANAALSTGGRDAKVD